MKVLIVINSYFTKGNGLASAVKRNVSYLRELGYDVKILSSINEDPNGEQPEFPLQKYKMPVFDELITKQGYGFAKSDINVIKEAISWADIIHLEEPFMLEYKVCKLANKMGVPVVATYHLHPENLFASVGLVKSKLFNNATLKLWEKLIYNRCLIVHCPTENVKQRLQKNKVKSELRVISNGLIPHSESKVERKKIKKDYYQILCVGRYSNEKDQTTLLDAMKYSKYKDKIQLVFAGRGPTENKLKNKAYKLVKKGILKYPPKFVFCSYNELMNLAHNSELYIHCAIVEVEGLSCIEVLKEGVVPIIAEGPLTATSQFAKDSNSVFKIEDSKELANKIDYWLDHPEERLEAAEKYKNTEIEYDINKSIEAIITMYNDALKKANK